MNYHAEMFMVREAKRCRQCMLGSMVFSVYPSLEPESLTWHTRAPARHCAAFNSKDYSLDLLKIGGSCKS
jgi:hypothetical protein